MAKFSVKTTDLEGNQVTNEITIPDFAMDSTLDKIVTILEGSKNLEQKSIRTIEQLTKNVKDGIDEDGKMGEKIVRELEKSNQINKEKLPGRIASNVIGNMEKDFRRAGNIITNVATALVSLGTITGGFLLRGFTNLGEGLKTLTSVGGAFGDSLTGVGASAEQNIMSLNRLGLTTDQALNVLGNYSRSMAILGQSSVVQANKAFLDLTDGGLDFGSTLDEATEFFQQDLQFRTMMLRRDQISTEQSIRTSAALNVNLRRLSTLLGINSDELRQNAQDVISGNTAFRAFAAGLSDGQQRIAGAEAVTTSLLATLGDAGGTVADGLLRISATGVGAIDEFVNQLRPIAGSEIADSIQSVAMGLRNGSVTVENANKEVIKIVQAFADADPARVRELIPIIDAVGGELAGTGKVFIEGFINAANSIDKFQDVADIIPVFSNTQEGLIIFQNTVAKAKGALSGFQNALATGAAPQVKKLGEFFSDLLKNSDLADYFIELGGKFGKVINDFMQSLNKGSTTAITFIDGIKKAGDFALELFENLLNAFETDGKLDIIGGIKNALVEGIKQALILSLLAIKEAFVAVITNPSVLASLVGAFGMLMAAQAVVRGVTTALVTGFGTLLGQTAVTQAIVTALAKWGLISTTGTIATTALGTGAATVGAGATGAAANKLLNKNNVPLKADGTPDKRFKANRPVDIKQLAKGGARLAGGLGATLMIGKDIFDVVAGTDGGATGKNVGGATGGLAGAAAGAAIGSVVPVIGTAVGAIVGGLIGNIGGGYIGGKLDPESTQQDQIATPSGDNIFNLEAKSVQIDSPALVRLISPNRVDSIGVSQASVNTDLAKAYSGANLTMNQLNSVADTLTSDVAPSQYTTAQKQGMAALENQSTDVKTLLLILEELRKSNEELKKSNRSLTNISDKSE